MESKENQPSSQYEKMDERSQKILNENNVPQQPHQNASLIPTNDMLTSTTDDMSTVSSQPEDLTVSQHPKPTKIVNVIQVNRNQLRTISQPTTKLQRGPEGEDQNCTIQSQKVPTTFTFRTPAQPKNSSHWIQFTPPNSNHVNRNGKAGEDHNGNEAVLSQTFVSSQPSRYVLQAPPQTTGKPKPKNPRPVQQRLNTAEGSVHTKLQKITSQASSSRQSKRSRIGSDCCTDCDTIIPSEGEQSYSMQCDECNRWTCLTCAGISRELYVALINNNISALSFLCTSCKQDKINLSVLVNKMQEMQNDSCNRLSSLEKKLDTNNSKFLQIESKLDTMKKELEERLEDKIEEKTKQIELKLSENLARNYYENTDKIAEEMNRATNKLAEMVDRTLEAKLTTFMEEERQKEQPPHVLHEMRESISQEVQYTYDKKIKHEMRDMLDKEVEKQLTKRLEDTGARPYAEAIKIAVSPNSKRKMQTEIETSIHNEIADRESRRNNLILFGIPEGSNDKTSAMELMTGVLEIDPTEAALTKTSRIGIETPGKTRGLLITFKNGSIKEKIFKNLKALKGTKFEKVSIQNDLTKAEREREKELRAKAKELEKNEGGQFRVKGPPWARKIIKI